LPVTLSILPRSAICCGTNHFDPHQSLGPRIAAPAGLWSAASGVTHRLVQDRRTGGNRFGGLFHRAQAYDGVGAGYHSTLGPFSSADSKPAVAQCVQDRRQEAVAVEDLCSRLMKAPHGACSSSFAKTVMGRTSRRSLPWVRGPPFSPLPRCRSGDVQNIPGADDPMPGSRHRRIRPWMWRTSQSGVPVTLDVPKNIRPGRPDSVRLRHDYFVASSAETG